MRLQVANFLVVVLLSFCVVTFSFWRETVRANRQYDAEESPRAAEGDRQENAGYEGELFNLAQVAEDDAWNARKTDDGADELRGTENLNGLPEHGVKLQDLLEEAEMMNGISNGNVMQDNLGKADGDRSYTDSETLGEAISLDTLRRKKLQLRSEKLRELAKKCKEVSPEFCDGCGDAGICRQPNWFEGFYFCECDYLYYGEHCEYYFENGYQTELPSTEPYQNPTTETTTGATASECLATCQWGVCSEIGECVCYEGYTGDQCQHESSIGTTASPTFDITDYYCHLDKPCLNGGTCEQITSTYSYCSCDLNRYYGSHCQIDYGCDTDADCHDHGSCTPFDLIGEGYSYCLCHNGYYGDHCEYEPECYCENGYCNSDQECVCDKGYSGDHCEIYESYLESYTYDIYDYLCHLDKPCQNGGTCETFEDQFGAIEYSYCNCDWYRYTGDHCQDDNACHEYNKCQNGGNCYEYKVDENSDMYSFCLCDFTKYYGSHCQYQYYQGEGEVEVHCGEVEIEDEYCGGCNTGACYNNTCCDNAPHCLCEKLWQYGKHCEIDIMEAYPGCNEALCTGHGECVMNPFYDLNVGPKYMCECDNQYYGDYCEEEIVGCAQNCGGNGECTMDYDYEDDVYYQICACDFGFDGAYCEIDLRDLPENEKCPCENDGICFYDSQYSVTYCLCQIPFTGPRCETDARCNTSQDCQNGGACADYSYCECPPSYAGSHCQMAADCTNGRCANGGTCVTCNEDGTTTHRCECELPYMGEFCEENILDYVVHTAAENYIEKVTAVPVPIVLPGDKSRGYVGHKSNGSLSKYNSNFLKSLLTGVTGHHDATRGKVQLKNFLQKLKMPGPHSIN
ncbi:fibropellin-1-like [Ptychodera flava]|uniref:fibropellin-1-like n=1 Tax=Ptychodera flava TaxID=63121 RepID=UPI00396A09E9